MEQDKSASFECIICLCPPKLPVATPCGHVFCWNCLKNWIKSQSSIKCPVCQNGFELNQVIKLFLNEDEKNAQQDDRPKYQQTKPKRKSLSSNFKDFFSGLGFGGERRDDSFSSDFSNINPTEVQQNRMALIIFILCIILIYFISK